MSKAKAFAWLLALAAPWAAADTICRITSSGGVAFGSYDVLATTPTDSLLNVTVTCDRNAGSANVTVTLGIGQGTNGTAANARLMRQLGGAGDLLSYGLYRDVGRSANWGFSNGVDTVSQTATVPNKGSAALTFVIYGRIPAQQDVAAGSYQDSVQITVSP